MLLFFFLAVTIDANEWSYTDPNDWGGTCSTGKEQSPINIDTGIPICHVSRKCFCPSATTEHITLPPLEFNDYNVRGSISDLNNGHTEMVQGFTSWTKQPSISGECCNLQKRIIMFRRWTAVSFYPEPISFPLGYKIE